MNCKNINRQAWTFSFHIRVGWAKIAFVWNGIKTLQTSNVVQNNRKRVAKSKAKYFWFLKMKFSHCSIADLTQSNQRQELRLMHMCRVLDCNECLAGTRIYEVCLWDLHRNRSGPEPNPAQSSFIRLTGLSFLFFSSENLCWAGLRSFGA